MEKLHLVWDCDSTLIQEESFDELAKMVLDENGAKQFRDITERGMRGELGFRESLRERVQTIVGLRVQKTQVSNTSSQLNLSASVLRQLEWFHSSDVDHLVVTGGFLCLLDEVLQPLHLRGGSISSNQFRYTDDIISGYDADHPLAHTGGKVEMVRRIAKERNWDPSRIVMIGDGATDRQVWEERAAGNYIAYAENVQRVFFEDVPYVAPSVEEVMSIVSALKNRVMYEKVAA